MVARLDKDQLLRQRDWEQAALAQAQSQLVQAGTTVEWTKKPGHDPTSAAPTRPSAGALA